MTQTESHLLGNGTTLHFSVSQTSCTRNISTGWRRFIRFVMIKVIFCQFDLLLKAHLEEMTYIITNAMILRHPVIRNVKVFSKKLTASTPVQIET